MALGTAPRRLGPGRWLTRKGTPLTPNQAAVWENYYRSGRTDGSGHMKTPSVVQQAPKPVKPSGPQLKPVSSEKAPRATWSDVMHGRAPKGEATYKQHRAAVVRGQAEAAGAIDRQFGTAIPLAKQASKTVNPKAAAVISGVGEAIGAHAPQQFVKAVKERKPVAAGLAAAALVPFGPGKGVKLVKAGEEVAKAGETAVKDVAAAKSLIPHGGPHELPGVTNPQRVAQLRAAGLSKKDATALTRTERLVQMATAKAEKAKPETQVALQKNLGDKVTALVQHKQQIEVKYGQTLPNTSAEAKGVAQSFYGAESGYKAQQVIKSKEYAARLEQMPSAYEQAGGGRAGHYAAKGQLKGAYTKVAFNDLKNTPEEDINKVLDEIHALPETQITRQEKSNLRDAILNAKDENKRPRPHEVAYMEKAFGAQEAADFAMNGRHIGDVLVNILNIPRALMSSGEVSSVFRQGLMAFAMHPKLAAKGLPGMFKDFASELHYQGRIADLHAHPEYENFVKDGGVFTELGPKSSRREEYFPSSYAENITGVGALFGKGVGSGSIVRMSGRAFTGFLDNLRLEMYTALKEEATTPQTRNLWRLRLRDRPALDLNRRVGRDLTRRGGGQETLGENLAQIANWSTGRGKFRTQKLEDAAPLLNSVWFAPRLTKTRWDAINPNFYAQLDPFAQRKALEAVVRLVAGGIGILSVAKFAGGADVELDPRSSDFGKMRFGKTRYDLWGGHQPQVRLIAQELTQSTKSSTTGEVHHLQRGERLDPLFNYGTQKLAPVPSLIVDVKQGEMFGHKPVTVLGEARQKGVPIWWQDLQDVIRTGSWRNTAGVFAGGLFGVGTQTYSSQKPDRHPGSGQYISPGSLPDLSQVGIEQGHGGLPDLSQVAPLQGH